jgi:hypothetical protein
MNEHFDIYVKHTSYFNNFKNIKLHRFITECIPDMKKKTFFLIVDKYKKEGIKIHILKKTFINRILTNKKLVYLTTIFLDKYTPLDHIYNWQILDEENKKNKIPDGIFLNGFKTYIPLIQLDNNIIYDFNDINFNYNLDILKTGYYFNFNDITWQLLFLNLAGEYSNTNLNLFNSKHFKYLTLLDSYYKNFKLDYIFDNYMFSTQVIFCDSCDIKICDKNNLNIKFWHSNIAGDLCNNCFIKKKEREIYIRKYVKNQLLLEGKKKVFKKELLKYKNINYHEIKTNKNYNQLKKISQNLIKDIFHTYKDNTCSICLDLFRDKCLFTGKCGHVFHENCCKNLISCPICRGKTKFFKIYI